MALAGSQRVHDEVGRFNALGSRRGTARRFGLNEETGAPSSSTRLFARALGLPVSYHVDNVQTERQAERMMQMRPPVMEGGATPRRGYDAVCASMREYMQACARVRGDARGARSHDKDGAVVAWDGVKGSLLAFHKTVCPTSPPEARGLMSTIRGEAMETILHTAYLLQLYDVARLILELEPMMLAATYDSSKYDGESVLHILAAQGGHAALASLEHVHRLALHAEDEWLFPSGSASTSTTTSTSLGESATAGGGMMTPQWSSGSVGSLGASGCTSANTREATMFAVYRRRTWTVLFQAEVNKVGEGAYASQWAHVLNMHPDGSVDARPTPAWCRAWLREAWVRLLHAQCRGTFFEKPPVGTCYYGGTALSIAAVLGHKSIIKFLAVDAGRQLHGSERFPDHVERSAALSPDLGKVLHRAGSRHVVQAPYGWGFTPRATEGGPHGLGEERAEMVVGWDASLCARLDTADGYGNTAGHMAVQHYADASMFRLLADTYAAGYGRWDSGHAYHRPSARWARAVSAWRPADGGSATSIGGVQEQPSPPAPPAPSAASGCPFDSLSHLEVLGHSAPLVFCTDRLGERSMRDASHSCVSQLGERMSGDDDAAPFTAALVGSFLSLLAAAGEQSVRLRESRNEQEYNDAVQEGAAQEAVAAATAGAGGGEGGGSPEAGSDPREEGDCSAHVPGPESAPPPPPPPPSPPSLTLRTPKASGRAPRPARQESMSALSNEPPPLLFSLVEFLERAAPLLCEALVVAVQVGQDKEGGAAQAGAPPSAQDGGSRAAITRAVEPLIRQVASAMRKELDVSPSACYVGPPDASGMGKEPLFSADAVQRCVPQLLAQSVYLAAFQRALEERHGAESASGERVSLAAIVNTDGLTPLTLAAQLGKRTLFEQLWAENAKDAWKWGAVEARCFPLDQIDDIGQVADDHPAIQDALRGVLAGSERGASFCGLTTAYGEAWCCGPRRRFRNVSVKEGHPPARGVCSAVSLAARWLTGSPPFEELSGSAEQRHSRFPTALEVMVQHGLWQMLEPAQEAEKRRRREGAAHPKVRRLTRTSRAVETPTRGQQHQRPPQLAADAPRLGALSPQGSGTGHTPEQGSGEEGGLAMDDLDGAESSGDTADCILLQLAERKWSRVYSVHFYRLMLQRSSLVVLAWCTAIARSSVSDNDKPVSECDSGGSRACGPTRVLVPLMLLVSVLSLVSYLVRLETRTHVLRRGAPLLLHSLARRGGCTTRKGREALTDGTAAMEQWRWSRGSALFFAGHGGSFGAYYTLTLLTSMVFSAVAAAVDLSLGWPWANIHYAVAGTAAGAHLLYFLLGFGHTGPLLVMLASVLTEQFTRWLALFVPSIGLFAFSLFVLDSTPRGDGGATGFLAYFKLYFLGALDASFQPPPSEDIVAGDGGGAVSQAYGGATDNKEAGRVLYLLVYLALVFISFVALLSLLVALLSHAFSEYLSTPKARWRIERARACMLLESYMSPWDRLSIPEQHRYYIWLPHPRRGGGRVTLAHVPPCPSPTSGGSTSPSQEVARPYFFSQMSTVEEEDGGGGGGGGASAARHTAGLSEDARPAAYARHKQH